MGEPGGSEVMKAAFRFSALDREEVPKLDSVV